jgi:hypothetical protein
MARMQRSKGAAGELEALLGIAVQRNLEHCRSGGPDLEPVGNDPMAEALRRFAREVKRHRAIPEGDPRAWWGQASKQIERCGRIAALCYRGDRQTWRVVVLLSALGRYCRAPGVDRHHGDGGIRPRGTWPAWHSESWWGHRGQALCSKGFSRPHRQNPGGDS